MKTSANQNFLSILVLLTSLSFVACIQPTQTGAGEEDQLYNTNGLQAGHSLFDMNGLAPEALMTNPIIRVGIVWDASDDTVLEGRFGDNEGNWSDWMPIEAYWQEEVAHNGHVDVPVGHNQVFQLRVLAGSAPSYLIAEGLQQVGETNPTDISVEGYGQLQQALAPSSLANKSRSDWGAVDPRCSYGTHSIYRATIHTTDTPWPESCTPAARMRQMQSYHMNTNGWCDIGYHFIVDPNGDVWRGARETHLGNHTGHQNTGNIGISFMGKGDDDPINQVQMNKAQGLLTYLKNTHQVQLTRSVVKGHREYNPAKSCPGDKIYPQIEEMLGGASTDPDPDPDPDPSGNGTLKGPIFADTGVGTSDMSIRISGANVSAGDQNAVTGAGDGMYTLSLPVGTYTVAAIADGYDRGTRSCTVVANQETWCSIGLLQGSEDPNVEPNPTEDGDDSGGDSGGEATPDPTGVWGGAPGLDDNGLPKGRIYGYVLEMLSSFDFDQCEGNRVPQALVRSDSGEWVKADDDGLFEIWVPGGTHTLFAKSAGYLDGGWPCTVAPGGETHCCIGVIPETLQESANDAAENLEDMELTGCASAPMNSSAGVLPLLLLAGLALRRRKTQ